MGVIITGFFIMLLSSVVTSISSSFFPLEFLKQNISISQMALYLFWASLLNILGIPIGGAYFGNYADKYGRKKSLMIAIIGFILTYSLTGLFIFYLNTIFNNRIFVTFSILSLLQGIFLGGEYAVIYPMIMEFSKKNRRGLVGGLVQSSVLWGFLLFSFLRWIAFFLFDQNGGINQPAFYFPGLGLAYFFILFLLIVPLIILYILPESGTFLKLKREKGTEKVPVFKIFTSRNIFAFFQILLLIFGVYIASYSHNFIINLLVVKQITFSNINLILIPATISSAFSIIFLGYISDIIGRRRSFLFASISTIILSIPTYYIIYISNSLNNLLIAMVVEGFITSWIFGLLPSYMSERFETNVRASGIGLGYGAGYFAAYLLESLWFMIYNIFINSENFTNSVNFTEIWAIISLSFLIVGSIIYGIAALLGPETRDLDLGT